MRMFSFIHLFIYFLIFSLPDKNEIPSLMQQHFLAGEDLPENWEMLHCTENSILHTSCPGKSLIP